MLGMLFSGHSIIYTYDVYSVYCKRKDYVTDDVIRDQNGDISTLAAWGLLLKTCINDIHLLR